MAFLQKVLEAPRYGFINLNNELVKPTRRQIWGEFFHRLNIFRDRRNWLPLFGWTATVSLSVPFLIYLRYFLSLELTILGFFYSMVFLGSHGTVYLHRYGTHRAYRFRNNFWVQVCRNLVIKVIPEEIYIVSHHVHHRYTEQPGDPYNIYGGWLYCFLADVNHQLISRNLSPEDYKRVANMVAHTGVKANSYEAYQRWGSICSPFRTVTHYALNWGFWYSTFYLIGGHALATALFGSSVVWAFGVRTFNYNGHGRGVDRRRKGIDFHWDDFSVNQVWPGYVAGEWHNNHHLFPNSARAGFLPYQLDLAWITIKTWQVLGIVTSVKDDRLEFLSRFETAKRSASSEPSLSLPV